MKNIKDPALRVHTLCVGDCKTNCYIIHLEGSAQCLVIDPGADAKTILAFLAENALCCKAILITHAHHDHGDAAPEVSRTFAAPIYICKRDIRPEGLSETSLRIYYWVPAEGLLLSLYDDGDSITVAGIRFLVLSTPGHTPGSVCLLAGDDLFSGDTLLRRACGRSDLKGGNREMLVSSLQKLCMLPGDYRVYPGHGCATTLDEERQNNPFCLRAMETRRHE